ncbi:hypothetical protein H072_7920 [Dactylellina haptotyla CBS 200.50]|uniref:Tafazzin family protein n=1 Tax=Dactylellina haptotyla (strain CBS 200.50) TaxID=1284197 RepID=S8A679_DACHA|nr:hypothetical protein H072_7920 [Dactylellina haptotyla CBS 200.50]
MATETILPSPGSTWLISTCALLSKAFLFGLSTTRVQGLENLTRILDRRVQPGTPESQNALITVSNHTSVMDDPIIWGVLPFRHLLAPANLRWTLGSHDICFKNQFTTAFFNNGQVLPTYRLRHSPHGGLFQPVINKTLLMLTPPPLRDRLATSNLISTFASRATTATEYSSEFPTAVSDPGSAKIVGSESRSPTTATTAPTGADSPPASSFSASASADTSTLITKPPIWLHIFPEGQIYQHPTLQMRYFKWGIARYILELPQPPIILPMFFSGMQNVLHEKRKFPRFIPRAGKQINITFGEAVPLERWDKVRTRWRELRKTCAKIGGEEGERLLREGSEAVQLRVEVALMVREEVEKLRVRCGYSPAEPESALAETFKNKWSYLHEFEADLEKHINS